MARGFGAKEGVAVDGKFVKKAVRSIPDTERDFLIEQTRREMEAGWSQKFSNPFDKGRPFTSAEFEEYKQSLPKEKNIPLVGKELGSPERVAELDSLRAKSAVPFVVYRGQAAYEVLDSKKAADVVRQQNAELRTYDKIKSTSLKQVGGQGSRGDGMYHFSPDPLYAAHYSRGENSGIVEGVVISKALLDLNDLSYQSSVWWGKRPEFAQERAEHFSKPTRFDFNKNPQRRELAEALVNKLRSEYRKTFNKEMPETAGLRGEVRQDAKYQKIEGTGNYKKLTDQVESELRKWTYSKSGGSVPLRTYTLLKMPFFKQFLKDTGFDAVAYKDISGGYPDNSNYRDGQPALALVKPNMFKSYYGDKKVNLKSPNMFDADPA